MRPHPVAPILIVEDNAETQYALRHVLGIKGYDTVTADDGVEVLAYLRGGGGASLILLDMRMPNMDGWALERALQADARFADIPVVIFSAHPAAAFVEGVAGYVRKGSDDPDVLLGAIERACQ